MKSKDTPVVIEGTKEAPKKMGEKPQLIYTDDKRAIAGDEFKEFVEGEGIDLYRTRNHPAYAERSIRTFKICFLKGLKQMKKRQREHPMD